MRLLEGFVALDLSDLRGQFCGKLLRELGMDVIKIEPPGGDPVRHLGPFAHDTPHPEGSLRFAYLNAGKQSVVLDLTSAADRARLLDLVARADVLLESFDPGTLAGLGLDAATLRARNPRLIITSISGFGQEGPYRDLLCPDLVGMAMGGLLNMAGDPSLPPVNAPETQGGYFASLYATFGTVLALWRRSFDGQGRDVDIAMQECLAYHEGLIASYCYEQHSIRREGSQHPHVAPAGIFPASDGYVYLFISQIHWQRFLDWWVGHPRELDDPRWIPNLPRRQHADWINAELSAFTSQLTRDEIVNALQAKGVPGLPVNPPGDYMRDEQVRARRFFLSTEHPVLGRYEQPSFPAVMNGERVEVLPPPLLGEHTAAVLGEIGAAGQAPAPSPAGSGPPARPLDKIRILSFTTGIAGPHAARALAQCGAEVIKIESRKGGLDSFRLFSPDGDIDTASRFITANMNVLSAQLNLKHPEGVRLLRELVGHCDVVMDNFGSDVLPRMGLGPDELLALKPNLIVLKMPGLGCAGPRAHWRTWGSTLNALVGMTYLWNHPGQEKPIGYQGVYPDYVTAALAPALVYAALLYRDRTGQGVFLDLAQAEAAAYMLGTSYLEVSVNGHDPQPIGNNWPYAAPHNVYPCQGEDRWVAIVVETDEQWRRLAEQLGRPELARDARYATLAARDAHRAELDALVGDWTREREPYAIMQQLQAAGVPCGVVQRAEDLVADPQYLLRGGITTVDHPRIGPYRTAAVPLHLSDGALTEAPRSALLGEHNAYVIRDILGYSPEQLAAWQEAGIVD